MSHRAYVAYQQTAGTYDLHYSHNGAQEYVLKDVLEGYLDGKVEEHAGDMPTILPTEVNDLLAQENFEAAVPDRELIETEPRETGLEPHEFGKVVNFFNTEMLYVVRDWNVEIFAPIHLSPVVLPHLQATTSIDVYEMGEPIDDDAIAALESRDPDVTLAGDDFTTEALSTLDEGIYTLLEALHLDILDFYNQIYHDTGRQSGETGLFADGYMFMVTITGPSYPLHNVGMFIHVPWNEDTDEPKYAWHRDVETEKNPRWRANEIRFKLSQAMDSRIEEQLGGNTALLETEQGKEMMTQETQKGVTQFIAQLLGEYGADVSTEFATETVKDHISEIMDTVSDSN